MLFLFHSGRIGVWTASLNLAVVLFCPESEILGAIVVLFFSALFWCILGHLIADEQSQKNIIWMLPLNITAFFCMGAIYILGRLYLHRRPHLLDSHERLWLVICGIGLVVCLLLAKRYKKHQKHHRHAG